MEFPHLGEKCSEVTCNRLDFLPVRCDACHQLFCKDHMKYAQHACTNALKRDVQVPVCPLCNAPVPSPRNQPPDIAVGNHIDQDCRSDKAKSNRKKLHKRCSVPGCKVKEIIGITCTECQKNFCLRHRFVDQHQCQGRRGNVADAAERRLQFKSFSSISSRVQGNMSEDEALAKALAESMKDVPSPPLVEVGGSSRSNQSTRCHLS